MKFYEAYKIMCEDPEARFISSSEGFRYRVRNGKLCYLIESWEISQNSLEELNGLEWTQITSTAT